jgi:hypothetical protein
MAIGPTICQFHTKIIDTSDVWLVFEVGGVNLAKSLFEVRGEFSSG